MHIVLLRMKRLGCAWRQEGGINMGGKDLVVVFVRRKSTFRVEGEGESPVRETIRIDVQRN